MRELEQHGLRGARLVRPQAGDDRDGQVVDPAADELEEADGRDVRPVEVVDPQHEGALRGEVREQPVEPAEHAVAGVARLGGGLRGEHARRAAGRTREGSPARVVVEGPEDGLEQLVDETEREPAVELGRPGAEHRRAVLLRDRDHGVHERGLADPRRPLEEQHAAAALGGVQHDGPQRGDLGVALQQRTVWHGAGFYGRSGASAVVAGAG